MRGICVPLVRFGLVIAATLLTIGGARAAGKSASFKVTAVQSSPQGQITMTSQVWITEKSARADMSHPLAGEMRVLVTGGNFYQLDTRAKKGVRGPMPPEVKKSNDIFDLLVSQLAFDAGAAMKTAKKIRSEQVSGYTCDVLTASKSVKDAKRTITVWMPVKMSPRFALKAIVKTEVKKPGVSATESLNITLSNIKLNQSIPNSMFAVPTGYKITEGKVPPPGSGPGGAGLAPGN